MPPRVFIASSAENLEVVNAIDACLKESVRIEVEPVPWHRGTFEPTETIIKSLETALDESNYAVLVLTPNDFVKSRGKKYRVPRDNALFELGLFMGRRGRLHCYIVHVSRDGKKPKFKFPTDLGGVLPIEYRDRNPVEFERTIREASNLILEAIERREQEKRDTFCGRIAGAWCENIKAGDKQELSIFRIVPNVEYTTINMEGEHFRWMDARMKRVGHWVSSAVGLQPDKNRVDYCWTGTHPYSDKSDPSDVQGYGWMKFTGSRGPFRGGHGAFMDLDRGRMDTAQWKDIELIRIREEYADVIDEGLSTRKEADAQRVADDLGLSGDSPTA